MFSLSCYFFLKLAINNIIIMTLLVMIVVVVILLIRIEGVLLGVCMVVAIVLIIVAVYSVSRKKVRISQ